MNRVIFIYLLIGVLAPWLVQRLAISPLLRTLAEQDKFIEHLNNR